VLFNITGMDLSANLALFFVANHHKLNDEEKDELGRYYNRRMEQAEQIGEINVSMQPSSEGREDNGN